MTNQSLESAALEIGIEVSVIDMHCLDIEQRVPTLSKPRKQNGGVTVFASGCVHLHNWETDERLTWHPDANRRPLNDEERRERSRQIRAGVEARERHQRQHRADAAESARVIWRRARPASPDHPYLVRKRLPTFDLSETRSINDWPGRWLVAACYDRDMRVRNLECIAEDGTKRPIRGAQRSGLFGLVGPGMPSADYIIVAEGWATGAALAVAFDQCVVIAYGTGNLKPTALLWRSMLRNVRITIAADSDAPGLAAATDAAQAVDGMFAAPRFGRACRGRTDWCDVYTDFGADVLRQWWMHG
jgi:putative DNA primase/helicase